MPTYTSFRCDLYSRVLISLPLCMDCRWILLCSEPFFCNSFQRQKPGHRRCHECGVSSHTSSEIPRPPRLNMIRSLLSHSIDNHSQPHVVTKLSYKSTCKFTHHQYLHLTFISQRNNFFTPSSFDYFQIENITPYLISLNRLLIHIFTKHSSLTLHYLHSYPKNFWKSTSMGVFTGMKSWHV